MLLARLLPGTLAAALLGGCVPQTRYAWNGYDQVLYTHYKNPQDAEDYVAGLKAVMLAAEERGNAVPPGIYAEYGFALYQQGKFPDAAVYFQKEHDLWPESRPLMQKMIRNAGQRQAPGTTTPAPAPPPPPASAPREVSS